MSGDVEWDEGVGTAKVNKVVGEVHLRKYGKFVDEYSDKLNNILDKFADEDQIIFGNDPVAVKFPGTDPVNVVDLANTDNKVLNKVVAVMAALCLEGRERVAEAQSFYSALLVFGEDLETSSSKALVATSKFLPKLQDLANFVDRCQIVCGEFLQQMAAIYTTSTNNQIISASNMHFEDMMQHLGDLLVVLVTLDALVSSLESLHETWALYKRLIPTVQLPGGPERAKNLSNAMVNLELKVLSGKMFRGALTRLSGWRADGSSVGEELQLFIRNMLGSLESKEPGLIQDSMALFLRTGCVLVLTATLFGLHDKRIMKQAWEVARRIPCVPLAGNCVWNPEEFIVLHLEHLLRPEDRKQASTLPSLRADLLTQRCKMTQTDLARFSQEACLWTIQLDTIIANETTHLTLEDLKRRCAVFLGGVKLANEVKRTLKLIMSLHSGQAKPMTRSTVVYLCDLTELLASINLAYQTQSCALAESAHHVAEFLAHGALSAINRATQRLTSDKGCTKRHLDSLSALLLAQSALDGPASSQRLLVARLALSIARGSQARVLREEEVDAIYAQLQQLDQLATLQSAIRSACDASHLYFQRVLLPVYLDHAEESRIPYLLNALPDVADVLPEESRQERVKEFEETMQNQLDARFLRRTREGVETSLRLQVHAHLQQEKILPSKGHKAALRLPPVHLFDKVLSVKSSVESYLDTTFYNLTTVALHDWRSYGEMRALARVQLGLELVKDSLPCQTLEQGVDILEVIKNIQVFVAGYQYNMNNQLFVERESSSPSLNTIGITHVSNSIRTHGTGIVNTTVNFIYQFLRNKFFVFSQFLFDEQIKSRLSKDATQWRVAHENGVESYPYEGAEKFVKGIRKLGMQDGLSYLDQFRILITHIGNAMGYVRLVRSGGMHACSNSLSFLPETEADFAARSAGLSGETEEAARRLDHVVSGLAANFADGSNYFRLLVDVFAADFRNPKHGHLNNFYMIVPPLTISFIDHMLAGKDKVARRKGGIWTDDGFAMGLAYVLTLLGQHERLDSLHWFEAARAQHRKEPAPQANDKLTAKRVPGSQGAASLLTAKRLDSHIQEFDLLAFNLNSAKIFFKKQVK